MQKKCYFQANYLENGNFFCTFAEHLRNHLQLENWDHGKHKKNTMKSQP